jgi:hypothetical protein
MPRFRIVLSCFLLTLLSAGLLGGVAWRALVRDVLWRRAGRAHGFIDLFVGRAAREAGFGSGLLFLPVTWGGVITFLSPLAVGNLDGPRSPALIEGPAIAVGLLGVWMAFAYALGGRNVEPVVRAGRRWPRTFGIHYGVAIAAGLPGFGVWLVQPRMEELVTPLTLLSFVAPGIGALVALWDAARSAQAPAEEERLTPTFGLALPTAALAVAWVVIGVAQVRSVGHSSILLTDADVGAMCDGAPGAELPQLWVPVCANGSDPPRVERVGGRRVEMCQATSPDGQPPRLRIVRVETPDAPGRVAWIEGGTGPVVATEQALITTSDSRRVVRIDGELEVTSLAWAAEGSLDLGVDERGLVVASTRGSSIEVRRLTRDGRPTGAARRFETGGPVSWVSVSSVGQTCVRAYAETSSILLVLDEDLRPESRSAWQRLRARTPPLLAAVLALAAAVSLVGMAWVARSGALVRRIRTRRGVWVGVLGATGGDPALVRTAEGALVLVETGASTASSMPRHDARSCRGWLQGFPGWGTPSSRAPRWGSCFARSARRPATRPSASSCRRFPAWRARSSPVSS